MTIVHMISDPFEKERTEMKTKQFSQPQWGTAKVSLLGVDSLWGDCTFIPADWGSYVVVDLCYFALFEDFSL